ncbi:MAG: hypothetical protein K2K56_09150 [Lachnospiraceae bacterium]|nr:hypothetical protein [Lachnospiraceae bacterium]
MTEQIIIVNKKKSELNARNSFDYEKIVQNAMNLIPCSYEEKEEEIIFQYECEGFICSNSLKKEDKLNQIQFLVNFARLYDLHLEYNIKFSTDNIYYDENYMPCVKERDLYKEGERADEERFLFLYKTYIGAVLGSDYTVTQLQESGLEILEQNIALKPFVRAKTKEDIVELLRKERKRIYEDQKNNMVCISKKENQLKNIVLIAGPILLVVVIGILIYYSVFLNPYQKKIIAANEAYVQKKYVECIDNLKEIDMDDMNINTKYILAFSYAKSESLEKEEIDMLTSRLSIHSNERELEYWICLGRMDVKMSESLAQSLSDDKLLIYAYLKELNQLQNNTSMDGEEKQGRIKQLEDAIRSLGDKYAPENEETISDDGTPALETTEVMVDENMQINQEAIESTEVVEPTEADIQETGDTEEVKE